MIGGCIRIMSVIVITGLQNLELLGSHNDVSVLSKSMMGLKKPVLIGGWVGGVGYIHFLECF